MFTFLCFAFSSLLEGLGTRTELCSVLGVRGSAGDAGRPLLLCSSSALLEAARGDWGWGVSASLICQHFVLQDCYLKFYFGS